MDTPEIRAKIRGALADLRTAPPPDRKGPNAIANYLVKNRAIFLDMTGEPPSHDTIRRCRDGIEIGEAPLGWIYAYLVHIGKFLDPTLAFATRSTPDPVFQMLLHRYAVRPHNLEDCPLLVGKFALYFNAEDIPDSVVRGAMEFSQNLATKAFEVTELQRSTKPPRAERWSGYYFHRREHFFLVMRGESRLLRRAPKFYILNTPHADDDDLVSDIGGRMLKIASGGGHTDPGTFATKVLLRRDPEAFNKCDVLPRSALTADPDDPDDTLLKEIDP